MSLNSSLEQSCEAQEPRLTLNDIPDIEYIRDRSFYAPNAERRFRGPETEGVLRTKGLRKAPPGLPPYIAELYDHPLLTPQGEKFLFRKFNYLKHKAHQMRRRIDEQRPKQKDIETVLSLLGDATAVKNES